MKYFWLLFLIMSSLPLQAETLGTIEVSGLSEAANRRYQEELKKLVPFNFSEDHVHKAIEAIYNTGSFTGLEVYFEDANQKTNIIVKISPVLVIKQIQIRGNRTFPTPDLISEMNLPENSSYSLEKVRAAVENIKKYYNLAGFLSAQVSADSNVSQKTGDMIILVNVTEGPPCLLSELNFVSVNNDLNEKLQNKVKKYVGQLYSQNLLSAVENDVKTYLYEKKYFSSTIDQPEVKFDPFKTKVAVNLVITDPYSFVLVFEGNDVISEIKILNELKLDSGNRLSNAPVEDLVESILSLYRKSGFANVTVRPKENVFAKDFIRRITFQINEGTKVRIKNIQFDGTYSRPEKYYREYLLEHSGDLIDKRVFNATDLETGIKNLVTDLQNEGYISAKVAGTRVEFSPKRDYVNVKVTLDEGPQTIIDRINFNGVKNVNRKELEEAIGLKAGSALQLNLLEESSTKLLEVYRNKGFLEAQVTNQGKEIITYFSDNTRAVLNFEMKEGPLITVDSIVVEGNSFTKDYVIRRELQFEKGEVLTPEKLNYSELRLQRLSLFTSIGIRTLEDDPTHGRRTVLVQVTEGNPGVFKSGVGVNNDFNFTVKGYVGAAYRNLFGTGRAINGRVEVNHKFLYQFYENDINFGYMEPFVFGTKNTGRLNLSRSRQLYAVKKVPQELVFALDTSQGDLLLERDFTQDLKMIFKVYGIGHTNEFEIYDRAASNPLIIATTGPTFLYDKRKDSTGSYNPFNPTRGFLSSLSFEFSHPYMGSTRTVSYYKSILSQAVYIPLGNIVWANEGKAGYLKNLSTLEDGRVPQIKAFTLGGRSTIRGFDGFREAIPFAQDFRGGIPTDSHFFLAKTELRIPIVGNFGFALFYDGGSVGVSGLDPLQRFSWRDAAGGGFRYATPFGPVSLEYGHKLNRDETRGESEGQIYFSIGAF